MPPNDPTQTPRYREARRRLYASALRLFRTKGFAATTAATTRPAKRKPVK